jgi:hypothetical protein
MMPGLVLKNLIISGKEYAKADLRWGVSDPTLISVEILTVLGVAPMALYILRQLINDDPARHYWIVVLCTAELYGGRVLTILGCGVDV